MGASEGGGAPWRESLQPLGPEGTRRVDFWGPGELELWERVSERCRGSDLSFCLLSGLPVTKLNQKPEAVGAQLFSL